MTDRTVRLRQAFAALDRGDVSEFGALLVDDAQWLGVEGSGWEGATPT
jgi:ketosteroid isomerase-like protein